MNKSKVSVVIIAKNEEKRIGRCLESVKWADEVTVVDGFSTDRTPQIAAQHGAKLIQHKFTGAFADDRNLGNRSARNDWVLQLDADDVVTPEFREKMEAALSDPGGTVVFKFRRVNFFLGHRMDHGGFHHYIPNLINRNAVRYEGVVHEVPVYEGAMGTLEADIEHYPFDTLSQFVERQNRYASIAAGEILRTQGRLGEKAVKKMMVGRSIKLFFKSYVKKQGYKEGVYGLVFAALFAFINFLKWADYWELVKEK